jgi:hypothetical protein
MKVNNLTSETPDKWDPGQVRLQTSETPDKWDSGQVRPRTSETPDKWDPGQVRLRTSETRTTEHEPSMPRMVVRDATPTPKLGGGGSPVFTGGS